MENSSIISGFNDFLDSSERLPLIISMPRSGSHALYNYVGERLSIPKEKWLIEYFNLDTMVKFTPDRIRWRWSNHQPEERMTVPNLERLAGRAALMRSYQDDHYFKIIVNHFSFLTAEDEFARATLDDIIDWFCEAYRPIFLYSRDVMQQTLSLMASLNTGQFIKVNPRDLRDIKISKEQVQRNADALLAFLDWHDRIKEQGLEHQLVERKNLLALTRPSLATTSQDILKPYVLSDERRDFVRGCLKTALEDSRHGNRFSFESDGVELIP